MKKPSDPPHTFSPPIRIAIVAGDPGGANNLVPVVHRLKLESNLSLSIWSYYQATTIFNHEHFDPIDLNADIDHTPPSRDWKLKIANQLISKFTPHVILSATSANDCNWEQTIIEVAACHNIASIALLDFWNNYRLRFTLPTNELLLPDVIAVMDSQGQRSLNNQLAGSSKTKGHIEIVGHPGYEALFDKFGPAPKPDRHNNKDAEKDAAEKDTYDVAFISQPIAQFYETHQNDAEYIGFNETIAFSDIVKICQGLNKTNHKEVRLHLLLHPRREDRIDNIDTNGILISTMKNETRYEAIAKMDLIIGMYSSFLLEADLLGADVVSYQPDRKFCPYEPSPLDELTTLMNYQELELLLRNSYTDGRPSQDNPSKQPNQPTNPYQHSAKAVVTLCLKLSANGH